MSETCNNACPNCSCGTPDDALNTIVQHAADLTGPGEGDALSDDIDFDAELSDDADDSLFVFPVHEETADLMRTMLARQSELNAQFVAQAVEKAPDEVLASIGALFDAYSDVDTTAHTPDSVREHYSALLAAGGWMAVAEDQLLIDYRVAAYEEGSELLKADQRWKFWKSPRPAASSIQQRLELIDVLHFFMSQSLVLVNSRLAAAAVESGEDLDPPVVPESQVINQAALFAAKGYSAFLENASESDSQAVFTPTFLLSFQASLFSLDTGDETHSVAQWESFWRLAHSVGLSPSSIRDIYTAKSALNTFRIANGDASGNYVRVWADDRKDDDYLMDMVLSRPADCEPLTVEATLAWLDSVYTD